MDHASWVVTDGTLWGKLSEVRRSEIKVWLRMNGIEPFNVPVDCTVMIAEAAPGRWEIWFEEYRRNENGRVVVDPDNPDEAYVFERSVPLEIDPPHEWLIPSLHHAA